MWARLSVHCLMIPRNVCFLINVPKSMWNMETVGLRLQALKLKYVINKAGKLLSCSSFHVLWEVSYSHETPHFQLRSLIQPQSSRVRRYHCNKSGDCIICRVYVRLTVVLHEFGIWIICSACPLKCSKKGSLCPWLLLLLSAHTLECSYSWFCNREAFHFINF